MLENLYIGILPMPKLSTISYVVTYSNHHSYIYFLLLKPTSFKLIIIIALLCCYNIAMIYTCALLEYLNFVGFSKRDSHYSKTTDGCSWITGETVL